MRWRKIKIKINSYWSKDSVEQNLVEQSVEISEIKYTEDLMKVELPLIIIGFRHKMSEKWSFLKVMFVTGSLGKYFCFDKCNVLTYFYFRGINA